MEINAGLLSRVLPEGNRTRRTVWTQTNRTERRWNGDGTETWRMMWISPYWFNTAPHVHRKMLKICLQRTVGGAYVCVAAVGYPISCKYGLFSKQNVLLKLTLSQSIENWRCVIHVEESLHVLALVRYRYFWSEVCHACVRVA